MLRISTALLYQQGSDAIGKAQSNLLRGQQMIAAGKRMLSPADDPVAAAQAITTRQAAFQLGRFNANVASAKDALNVNETVLAQVTDVLQNVRTTIINGGNGSLSAADRQSLAFDLRAKLDQLVGLANSQDAAGGYLFSGFQTKTVPFAQSGANVVYQGDQGSRTLEVSPNRTMTVGIDGHALFQAIKGGNGTFTATAAAANTGSVTLSAASVVDPTQLTGHSYSLNFSVVGGVPTYNVVDDTTGLTELPLNNSYTSGGSVVVHGMQIKLQGTPAGGDSFTLAPSVSQDLFKTLSDTIAAISIIPGGVGNTRITNGLFGALQNVDGALEHILMVRADGGANLRELDDLSNVNEDRSLQYEQTLSRLEDLDYNRALSDFAQQQVALEAAQKSFVKISSLSLFDYL